MPKISIYESTPKSPYAKNAFRAVAFADDFAAGTTAIINTFLIRAHISAQGEMYVDSTPDCLTKIS